MDIIVLLASFFFIGGGVITAIIMSVEIKKHRPVKSASDADMYLVSDETEMRVMEDSFLRTHTTRRYVGSNTSQGGISKGGFGKK